MHAKPGLRAGFSACKIVVPARLSFSLSRLNIMRLIRSHKKPGAQTHWSLWIVKLFAVVISLTFAIPEFPELNFVSVTFYIAIIGLLPWFRWTIPCLIVGFWLAPILFAFRVNGSFAEDLTTAIVGGIIGFSIGLFLDIQNHLVTIKRYGQRQHAAKRGITISRHWWRF